MNYTLENLFQKSVKASDIAKLCGVNINLARNYIKQKKKEFAEEIKYKQRIGKIMSMAKVNEDTAKKVYEFCTSQA